MSSHNRSAIFQIDTGYASLAGTKPINEDFCGAMLPDSGQEDMGAIAAVADGVSTGGMGREAAQTTVVSVLRDYFGTPKKWDATVALDRIISAQNSWLASMNQRRLPASGLTTLTALVLRGHAYTLAHVGDSRAYLLRGGELTQLTTDHIVNHPDMRHQLIRAVGVEDRIVVDYLQGDVQVGDVFLLVTDGVHGVLRTRQLKELLIEPIDSKIASEAIVDKALQAGSQDNVTALIVRVQSLLDANLEDDERASHHLPIPPLRESRAAFRYSSARATTSSGVPSATIHPPSTPASASSPPCCAHATPIPRSRASPRPTASPGR